jgi:hypothetical protein
MEMNIQVATIVQILLHRAVPLFKKLLEITVLARLHDRLLTSFLT